MNTFDAPSCLAPECAARTRRVLLLLLLVSLLPNASACTGHRMYRPVINNTEECEKGKMGCTLAFIELDDRGTGNQSTIGVKI